VQDRACWTRLVILRAAAETFGARGYAATSLQDIASYMGASKGALYFHFASKKEIALAVIEEYYDQFLELIHRLRQRHTRAIWLLFELTQETVDITNKCVVMRAAIRLVQENNLVGATVPRPFSEWIDVIDELLKEMRAQGDLLPDVDTESAAWFIASSFAGYRQLSGVPGQGGDGSRQINAMWRYLLPGLVNSECISEMEGVLTNSDGR
jgi:AcrR family transcriptional regulator